MTYRIIFTKDDLLTMLHNGIVKLELADNPFASDRRVSIEFMSDELKEEGEDNE